MFVKPGKSLPTPRIRPSPVIWCDLGPCFISTSPLAADTEVEQKELRAASVPWFDPHGESPNDTEILFVALLVIVARESVSELNEWADEVLEREAVFKECSEAGLPAEWRVSQKLPVPAIYQRIHSARQILPSGAVLWAWDADPEFDEVAGEQWLVLLPNKWNPSTHRTVYSWRYNPRELGALRAPERDQRRKQAKRVVEDA